MDNTKILLNHGAGGRMTHELIRDLFFRHFDNPVLKAQTDSAIVELDRGMLAFTTDSYVVDPIFFPGGDIGKLAVCGTVNDLSVSGAHPRYLSAGFIIEEGFPFTDLEKIVISMAGEARRAGVNIVTGDTKVVDRGKCDKIFINTAGIGILDKKYGPVSSGKNITPGDVIIINGNIGDHGTAILCARNSLEYSSPVQSDCAPLNGLIAKVLEVTDQVHFMRDATRGGLANVLCEVAEKNKLDIEIDEKSIPVQESVRGLCEVFGFDPLYMANEGKVVIVVAAAEAEKVLRVMSENPLGMRTAIVGKIKQSGKGKVIMNTAVGGKRIVDMLAGEQLPRIC
jgi:hydrogenase expression/formation protein HypE